MFEGCKATLDSKERFDKLNVSIQEFDNVK
jgi:hypothetical protein